MRLHVRAVMLCLFLITLCLAGVAYAQDGEGTLVVGQPLISTITTGGESHAYTYTLAEARAVSLQAISETAQPTLRVLDDGEVIAAQANADGTLIANLIAYLDAGTYTVEVGAANGTTGTLLLAVQSETAVTTATLTPAAAVSDAISATDPVRLYTFSALAEPAYLYVEGESSEAGLHVRLVDTMTGRTSAMLQGELSGARLRIASGNTAYQLEVVHSGTGAAQLFNICLTAVSAGGCEAGSSVPPATNSVIPTSDVSVSACTVAAASAGGVNIRQSASVNAIIIGVLPGGAVAPVVGISPDGTFYTIVYNGLNGWVALSVVTSNGDCANVPTLAPPPIIFPTNTATPIPTNTPIPPTNTPVPTPTNTPSGPCLITMTDSAYVYTQPDASPDNLYDQVQAGYQLIPTGRLADNSWWLTNYGGAWIETSNFGTTAVVTGNCSNLPIVSA